MRSEQAVENLAEAEHWHRLAIDRLLENDCLQAFEFVKKAIAIDAGRAHFFSTAGSIFQTMGQYEHALAMMDEAIRQSPASADFHFNKGNVFLETSRFPEAIAAFLEAIRQGAEFAEVFYNCAMALSALGEDAPALHMIDRAIEKNGTVHLFHYNRALYLEKLGRDNDALVAYQQALVCQPDHADSHFNAGCLHLKLSHAELARVCFAACVVLEPASAQAHNNLGNALHDLRCYSQALESFDRALSLNPGYAEAFNNKGNVLKDLKRLDEALACYEQALHLKPDYEYLPGMVLHMKMFMCQWDGYEQGLNSLLEGIEAGQKTTLSFPVLGLTDRADVQRQAAEILGRDKYPEQDALGPCLLRAGREKIRVGYFSADFHNHATAYLIAELFEQHDRSRFEVLGFSYGHMQQDEMRTRLLKGFDQFHEVRHLADIDIARLSRSLGVDIAVDLKGLTQDHRLGIFAYRAAPVQVSYLGYPGTTGVPYMDYVLADRVVIPEGSQGHYSEKVIYLPDSYQVNDSKRTIAQRVFSRSELGLPESGFVFCSFNNNYKITPQVFGCWMAMLKAVPGSVLWLLQDNPWAVENLRQQALRQGVAPERLVFAQRTSLAEHLARQRVADLFVDTFPCNAHTTASDALWAGLPLLTLAGESFASRVAASLLNAVGLPELVCGSLQEYQAQAVGLAQDGPRLKSIRTRLNEQLHNAPLFDARRFCQTLEENFLLLVKS